MRFLLLGGLRHGSRQFINEPFPPFIRVIIPPGLNPPKFEAKGEPMTIEPMPEFETYIRVAMGVLRHDQTYVYVWEHATPNEALFDYIKPSL